MKVEEKLQPDHRGAELEAEDVISKQTMQQSDHLSEQEGQFQFGASAWTFPFVIGLVPAGRWDVTFSILLLLLNLGMQAAFTIIISTDDFRGIPFWHQINYAKRWRISMAHDYQYLDMAGRSLVSRVCAMDGALILSTTQASLVEQINSFLGLQEGEFEVPFFQPGLLLCMLCISVVLFIFSSTPFEIEIAHYICISYFVDRRRLCNLQVSSFGAFVSTRSTATFGWVWRWCGKFPALTSRSSATIHCAVSAKFASRPCYSHIWHAPP